MTKEEFDTIIDVSIKFKHSNKIYYCYNKNIARQLKYKRLFNYNKKYIFNVDDIIFEQNLSNNNIIVKYEYWDYFCNSFDNNFIELFDLLNIWFVDKLNSVFTGTYNGTYKDILNKINIKKIKRI